MNKEAKSKIKKDDSNLYQPIADELLPDKFNPFERPVKNAKFANNAKKTSEYEERLIKIKRVIKVTKGGRRFKFSALVVVGDRKGMVGYGLAKHIEVPEAIKKAVKQAIKNLQFVKFVGEQDTIPHEIIGQCGSARVLLKPASEGKGIIASYNVRSVVELAGIRNIYSKNLGSNNPQNMILATLDALKRLRTKEEIAKLKLLSTQKVINKTVSKNVSKEEPEKVVEDGTK